MVEDTEVNDFLYNTTAYMRDADETATLPAESPPPMVAGSVELDGIDGRSFHHRLQRQMRQERYEADALAHIQQQQQASQGRAQGQEVAGPSFSTDHPHFAHSQHLLQQQSRPQQIKIPILPLAHPPQQDAIRPVRSESSLSHALDESYLGATRARSPSLSYPPPNAAPFFPQLAYPPSQALPAHHDSYSAASIIEGTTHVAPLNDRAGSSIKTELWEDEDPNDYILRAAEESLPYHDTSLLSFESSIGSDHHSDWASALSHTVSSYPYHSY